MSRLPLGQVYRGFWTDHSQGTVLGATLTLDSGTANVVVAILSVLVTFAGSHLWDIIAFCFFALHNAMSPRDQIHHQRQLILRNINSPAAVLFKTTKIYWSHRRLAVFLRLGFLFFIAAICSCGFLIAGLVSSQVVSTSGITVLTRPPSYGAFSDNYSLLGLPENNTGDVYNEQLISTSVEYTRACYNGTEGDPACQVFVLDSVPFDTLYAQECPFSNLCALHRDPALRMDTGMMWSNETFGMNVKAVDALALRKVTMCAPLNTSAYESIAMMDEAHLSGQKPFEGEQMLKLYLGPVVGLPHNDTLYTSTLQSNRTLSYSLDSQYWFGSSTDYFDQSSWYTGGSWEPIEALMAPDRDLVIIVLHSNMVVHYEPVDDPLFAAHNQRAIFTDTESGVVNMTYFIADDLEKVVACSEQFCLPNGNCTTLTHIMSAAAQASKFDLNPKQNATLYSYANVLINYSVNIQSVIFGYGRLLLAQSFAYGNTNSIPPNQWELEIKHWEAIILTLIQKMMADVGAGIGVVARTATNVTDWPRGEDAEFLLGSQKMKAPSGVSNVNVFGLSLIVAFCGFAMLINFTLINAFRWVSHATRKNWNIVRLWDKADIIELQKLIANTDENVSAENATIKNLSASISSLPDDESKYCAEKDLEHSFTTVRFGSTRHKR